MYNVKLIFSSDVYVDGHTLYIFFMFHFGQCGSVYAGSRVGTV